MQLNMEIHEQFGWWILEIILTTVPRQRWLRTAVVIVVPESIERIKNNSAYGVISGSRSCLPVVEDA